MATAEAGPRTATEEPSGEYSRTKSRRFRFKSKRKQDASDSDDLLASHPSQRRSRTGRSPRSGDGSQHHRHHHRRKKAADAQPDDPTLYDSTYLPNARSGAYLDPETAFRESLFDALADDEGAAFWEGVYGQPIHTFEPPLRPSGPEGELERMGDDEYAAYVRGRMYEKTHQHIVEERERRDEARKRRREAESLPGPETHQRSAFERDVKESLARGEDRKRKTAWKRRWEDYCRGWDAFSHSRTSRIPWPVESGSRSQVADKSTEVEDFFKSCSAAVSSEQSALTALLKVERVRWHPDKMQQRLVGLDGADDRGKEMAGTKEGGLDGETMKAVTAVFQVVDHMWNEERARGKA